MGERSRDWLGQAERDLRHAHNAKGSGDFEWSCFAAQQAAEKAVKAVYHRAGLEGWGHSVKQLLDALPQADAIAPAVREAGLYLDRFYILTRYPDGFPQGIPGEFFTARDADEAIRYADSILAFCRERLGV